MPDNQSAMRPSRRAKSDKPNSPPTASAGAKAKARIPQTNKFSALADNISNDDDDVVQKLDNELAKLRCDDNNEKIAVTVARMLLPIMNVTITNAVKPNTEIREELNQVKSNVLINKYQNDRLEQYTRRENIRIHNYPEVDGDAIEDLTTSVLTLLNDLIDTADTDDSGFVESDISVCHRIGKKGVPGGAAENKKPRQIIVRFVSRRPVIKVFKHKSVLKNIAKYNGIYITDDLTQLRMKLKSIVKGTAGISQVRTIDGNIHCKKGGKSYVISDPDDLFDLGVEVDFKTLDLEKYV